jgi:hypothetical protein
MEARPGGDVFGSVHDSPTEPEARRRHAPQFTDQDYFLALRKIYCHESMYAQYPSRIPMTVPFISHLRRTLHKELLLDIEDRTRAGAIKAFEMVRDRAGLDKRRARELEGQARFRMMEQGFEEVCGLHGGRPLEGGLVPSTDLKVFQPFMRFESEGRGVILGLAAMPDRKSIPVKNKSRLAGVSLNYDLSPRLDLDGTGPKIGDVFALLLVSRDKAKAGRIEEMAIGVIDSKYSTFLFYERLDQFLSVREGTPAARPTEAPVATPAPAARTVTLKKHPKPFVPPEAPKRGDEGETKEK